MLFGGGVDDETLDSNASVRCFFPLTFLLARTASAEINDGALKMEVISAYNLVVDSNIESPAGRCPTAAHLGLRVYNTGVTPLTGVTLRIGDLLNPATFSGTAGVYPVTSIAPGLRG